MALTQIPVGGYANITQVVSAAAQTAILAELAKFTALVTVTAGQSAAVPMFDSIDKETSVRLLAELTALAAAIDAAPTA